MRIQAFCLANSALATTLFLILPGLWPVLAVLYLTAVTVLVHIAS